MPLRKPCSCCLKYDLLRAQVMQRDGTTWVVWFCGWCDRGE